MKATEEGLLNETEGRELGGTFEFSPEEALFFSHIASMQSAKANFRARRVKKMLEEEEES